MTIREALDDEIQFAPRDYMITRKIPYQIRWKIMHMKLLLNDVKDIAEKHDLPAAVELYQTLRDEVNSYLNELSKKMSLEEEQEDANSV